MSVRQTLVPVILQRALRIAALASLTLVPAAFAQNVGGTLRTETDRGTRAIEFNATGTSGGRASGDILLSEPVVLTGQDVDGDGIGDPEIRETVSLRIAVDCLKVERNRAVLGGLVRESSAGYVGRRMLLTVEDNAETERREPDRYSFGLYRSTAPTWVPTDAELHFDEGAGMEWVATDAERDDDKGISSRPRPEVDCEAFPLTSFDLEDLSADDGDVQIRP